MGISLGKVGVVALAAGLGLGGLGAALADGGEPERTDRVELSADAFARKTEGEQDDLLLAGGEDDDDDGTRDRTGTNRGGASRGVETQTNGSPTGAGGATFTRTGDSSNRGAGAAAAESRGTNRGAASRGVDTQTNGSPTGAGGATFTRAGDSSNRGAGAAAAESRGTNGGGASRGVDTETDGSAPAGGDAQSAGSRDTGGSRPAAQPKPAAVQADDTGDSGHSRDATGGTGSRDSDT